MASLFHDLLVISPGGKKANQLLYKDDGLWYFTGVFYFCRTQQLTVAVLEGLALLINTPWDNQWCFYQILSIPKL